MRQCDEAYEPLYEEVIINNIDNLIYLLADKKDLIVLESSRVMTSVGRYSFICVDSFASFTAKGTCFFWNNEEIAITDPFSFLMEKIARFKLKKNDALPVLQGGIVGYFGYEASHYLENLPTVLDYINLPDMYLNFYSTVIALDHVVNKSWIIATGFPEEDHDRRIKIATNEIKKLKSLIAKSNKMKNSNYFFKINNRVITSNFSKNGYVDAIGLAKKYILEGDIFEVNISQQFNASLSDKDSRLALYFKLKTLNPVPFSALIKIPNEGYILSASPERFVQLVNGFVETCPIKGTRKRSPNPAIDLALSRELLTSEKDRAENIMIVDLMRNDLSKVCQPSSINVEKLCQLESFKTVHHLVSKITGTLNVNLTALDLLKATFPAGSITGAPKIRAMELISLLEKRARGPYCGSIGYVSFTGDMDTSVIIRSYFINKDQLFYSAGGAVVLDSKAYDEYLESMAKADILVQVLTK